MAMLINDGYQLDFNNNLTTFSATKLCEIIVSARYFGSMDEQAILCMQELARRRAAGDEFDYENFIEMQTKKLPDFKFNMKKKMQVGGFDFSILKGIK